MEFRFLLTLFVLVVAVVIYTIWNPFDHEIDLTYFGVIVSTFTLVVLAYELYVTNENFIEDHRPYIAIDVEKSQSVQILFPSTALNEVDFRFTLCNAGKSPANDVYLQIHKACLTKSSPKNQIEIDKCFLERAVNVVTPDKLGKLSFYPGDEQKIGGLAVTYNDLQTLFKGGEKLLLQLLIDYEGPHYRTGAKKYRSSSLFLLDSKDKEGKNIEVVVLSNIEHWNNSGVE